MKKILLALLMFALLLLCCSCGGSAEHVTHLSADSKTIADTVRAGADFSQASFTYSDEENASTILMFSYGVEDEALISAISDYAISTITSNTNPAYFAVVRCADGTDSETILKIATTCANTYAQYVQNQMTLYGGGDALELAENYTLHIYDNGFVLCVYSADGNDAILSLVDSACN